jgi:hypothetical protein
VAYSSISGLTLRFQRARHRQNARLRWLNPVPWCENIRTGFRPEWQAVPSASAQWMSLSAYLAGAKVFSMTGVGL